jgi:predicted transcriptional regulator
MSLELLLVSSVMSKDVKTETEEQNLMAVCRVMHENNVGSVIITKIQDKQRIPTGIITKRDIVRSLGKLTIDLRKPISDFMSKPIISIQSNSSKTSRFFLKRTTSAVSDYFTITTVHLE